ncbi:surfeit locus 1 family protein [Methylobacter tundripaludum]|uniref:SURF1-like protein n=1 Tax=Methylobacter tundripaludum TaxID=173365 RepID=A0A2S6H9W6_9GAMM|nr:SURF1 family protein [Methylobacter tundripaludum]PPK74292.1 surfeit locus 1 family protein [Methylobacter tundripaludum]
MKFKIIPTLVYLCLLPTLIALGMWQLDRSEQKRAFLKEQEQALATETLHLSTAIEHNTEALRYRNVEATGRYDVAHQFLIDNQISDGKAGYFVLTPFILTWETKAVLVNRGWIPLNQDRSILPDLQINKAEAIITGRINNFPSVGIKLAGAEIPTEGWPSVVQVVDSDVLAKKLGYSLFQFQIELAKELPDGYKREWHTSTIMQPEQHTAYAIQWFALALTLTILFIWYSFKNNDAKSKK